MMSMNLSNIAYLNMKGADYVVPLAELAKVRP